MCNSGGRINSQNNHPENRRRLTQLALGGTSILPVITSSLALRASSLLVVVAVAVLAVLVFIILGVLITPLRFTLSHIRRQTHPRRKPQHGIEHIHTGKGVDVSETTGARPYGDCYQVDQSGDTSPALVPLASRHHRTDKGEMKYQSPVPRCSPIDPIALGPDGYGESPCQEDEDCLDPVRDGLHPPGVHRWAS